MGFGTGHLNGWAVGQYSWRELALAPFGGFRLPYLKPWEMRIVFGEATLTWNKDGLSEAAVCGTIFGILGKRLQCSEGLKNYQHSGKPIVPYTPSILLELHPLAPQVPK